MTSPNARFVSFVPGQWYLEVNIRKSDTQHIPIGWYSYNSFLGDVPLEAGLLQMMDCNVPSPAKRNYPAQPLPVAVSVPFSNLIQIVRFDPRAYIDKTTWTGGILP